MTPARFTFSEVVAMSRLSAATLRRRWRLGKFPAPVDRGKQLLFDRSAILRHLGLEDGTPATPPRSKWIVRNAAGSSA